MPRFLLIDVSNTFTKWCWADGQTLGERRQMPTRDVRKETLDAMRGGKQADLVALSSVVPQVTRYFSHERLLLVSHEIDLGVSIDYPAPDTIGADRLANAAAAAENPGAPVIVVDFGTAVTFDVVEAGGVYRGGVIAPGLSAMTDYLHEKTALLPEVRLRKPAAALGRTTEEAMLSGAWFGYRGLVTHVVQALRKEMREPERTRVLATGGDGREMAQDLSVIDETRPNLTLEGLRLIALRNFTPD